MIKVVNLHANYVSLYSFNSMLKIILTGKSLIQLNFIVNIHITYNALTLILFIVLRMLIIHDLSIDVQNPLKAA